MKRRIRKTGEVVKIIVYSNIRGSDRDDTDFVCYIDSKGVEHYENRLNMCLDFEDVEKNNTSENIDWERRRYEIAKIMMHAIYLDDGNAERSNKSGLGFEYKGFQESAKEAVRFADALIAELKKGGEK